MQLLRASELLLPAGTVVDARYVSLG
jgi:hypothetical protein